MLRFNSALVERFGSDWKENSGVRFLQTLRGGACFTLYVEEPSMLYVVSGTLVPYVVEESVQQCVVSAAGGRQLVAGGGRGNMWSTATDHHRGGPGPAMSGF